MARTKRALRREPAPDAANSITSGPVEADEAIAEGAGESPALRLRQRVESAFSPSEERWSPRRTLAFIVLVCGAFWATVVAVVLKLG